MHRTVLIIYLALASACLTACTGFERGNGIAPVLDAQAVVQASAGQTAVLRALAADAGFDPNGIVDWYLVSEAGFNYVDDRCRAYFDELFFFNRGREQAKSALSAAGQTTAAILGVTGGSGDTLAIVAQAFGFAINATDLVAGTFLYQLPPATTQGFVEKLQLAFRDAAGARRASINSPTIAYHMIQRYLDLCLPPRIEAEITRQISSTTAIPVAQGTGSLFSIETESVPSAAALQPLPFLRRDLERPVTRRADEPLPDRRRTPKDSQPRKDQARIFFVSQVQKALCEPANGVADSATIKAIRAYLRARRSKVPLEIDPVSPSLRSSLEEAVTDVPDCAGSGFKNAYEVGRFGVPSDQREERITRVQGTIGNLLRERGSSLVVSTTGRFDPQTRKAIMELRRLTGTTGDEIDFDLDLLLQS